MLKLSPHAKPRHALRSVLPTLWTALLLVAGTLFALNVTPALANAAPATAGRLAAAAPADTAVTTFKNDVERDGDFSNETMLNDWNVNVNQFGKRVQYSVDGQVYAEPTRTTPAPARACCSSSPTTTRAGTRSTACTRSTC
jgi:hypothetical protein